MMRGGRPHAEETMRPSEKGSSVPTAGANPAPPFIYTWHWRKRPVGQDRKGQRCRVLVRGAMNSRLVEFQDGYRVVTSGNAIRGSR